MKNILAASLLLIVTYSGHSQPDCPGCCQVIVSPIVPKPLLASIAKASCTTLTLQWTNTSDEEQFEVQAFFIDPVSHQETPASKAKNIHCDANQTCSAELTVSGGQLITWSVRKMTTVDDRQFASYWLQGEKNYAVPSCGVIVDGSSTVAEEMPTIAADFVLLPNPSKDFISYRWSSNYIGDAQLRMFDISGRSVKSILIRKAAKYHSGNISLEDLRAGVYFISISTGKKEHVISKLVKVN